MLFRLFTIIMLIHKGEMKIDGSSRGNGGGDSTLWEIFPKPFFAVS